MKKSSILTLSKEKKIPNIYITKLIAKLLLIVITVLTLNGCIEGENGETEVTIEENTTKVDVLDPNDPNNAVVTEEETTVDLSNPDAVVIAGLTWQNEAYTDEELGVYGTSSSGKVQNWQGAKDYCENLDYAGYSDWTLPTKDQLQTLYTQVQYFKNNTTDFFWSSSIQNSDTLGAWSVYFGNGGIDYYNKSAYHYVRCIREI